MVGKGSFRRSQKSRHGSQTNPSLKNCRSQEGLARLLESVPSSGGALDDG